MKRLLYFVLSLILIMPIVAFADEVNSGLVTLLNIVAPFLAEYAGKWPWLAVVLKVMFYTRLIVKPLMSAAVTIGEGVPDGKYRQFMKSMSGHPVYKVVSYLLDWFASIKLPQAKK